MADVTAKAITIRKVKEDDIAACGRIVYEAFNSIAQRHGYPPDFPNAEVGTGGMKMLYGDPGFYGVVAERDGTILGSNWLDERSTVSGLGPITVDPAVQDGGIGRQLMDAIIERSDARGFPGVRLLQAAYHMRSLSLYTKLDFVSREEMVVMNGVPADPGLESYAVRPMTLEDIDACNELCIAVHGFHRGGELPSAIEAGNAFVAERDGGIVGYTSGLGYFGHSIGETTDAICALLAFAPHMQSPGILMPVRNYRLFRWCLDHGMRAVMTMTLMTRGLYQDPDGPYLTSILY
ncbi:MAG TPA: GNAT family N-acetyltransferase [Candidatus Baltobacteraceae bacterium]|nr:GNAT family N-acetyltransferase [Candidatus Baltobacteraceae bacterium]